MTLQDENRHLLLLGAGHAHLKTIHAIPRFRAAGVDVTVVDPNAELWYSGMVPSVVGGRVCPAAAAIPTADLVRRLGGTYLRDTVVFLDAHRRRAHLASGRILSWTVASAAVGSRVDVSVPVHGAAVSIAAAKPVKDLPQLAGEVLRRLGDRSLGRRVSVVFVGGGPSAVELAGNLAGRVARERPAGRGAFSVTVVTRSDRIMARMPHRASTVATRSLRRRGIVVRTESAVQAIDGSSVRLAGGECLDADIVVFTTGLHSPSLFADSDLPVAADGALWVDERLQATGLPVYGGGDCVAVDGRLNERVGVHAVRQGDVLAHNLQHAFGMVPDARSFHLSERPLLIVNLGDGRGILTRGSTVRHGRVWMVLKERIDWGFVSSAGRSIHPALRPPPRPDGC